MSFLHYWWLGHGEIAIVPSRVSLLNAVVIPCATPRYDFEDESRTIPICEHGFSAHVMPAPVTMAGFSERVDFI